MVAAGLAAGSMPVARGPCSQLTGGGTGGSDGWQQSRAAVAIWREPADSRLALQCRGQLWGSTRGAAPPLSAARCCTPLLA